MEKQILTALLVLVLVAPQTGLEAKSRHHGEKDRDHDAEERDHEDKKRYHKAKKRHHNSRKLFRFARATKAELELLKQAISDINAKMDALEPQGQLPADLAEDLTLKLQALELAIGENTVDITFVLNAIDGILIDIADNKARLLILEQSTPPAVEPDLVITGTFIQGAVPAPSIGEDWLVFRSKATGSFASIKISSSNGGSAICSDPGAATNIANELNSHVPTTGSLTTFACQDKIWNVGECGVGAVELNASLSSGVCKCDQGATLRPRIGSINWGGVGSDFGGPVGPPDASCFGGAPSQTLTVTLTR